MHSVKSPRHSNCWMLISMQFPDGHVINLNDAVCTSAQMYDQISLHAEIPSQMGGNSVGACINLDLLYVIAVVFYPNTEL